MRLAWPGLALIMYGHLAQGADSMRCSNKLIGQGDVRAEVLAKCGEPADVDRRSIARLPYYWLNGQRIYYGREFVDVPVEIWTYNFGPYRLMQRVRLVDGIVEEIETLGYGYLEDDTPRDPRAVDR